jgi:hypothetical protein
MKQEYILTDNSLASRQRETADSSQLRTHLSAQRKFQIDNFLNNDPKVLELEKKYGKYLLVPLALPVFEVPDPEHFLHWWKQYAIRPIKQKGDYVASVTGYSPFESIDLIQKIGDDWNLNLQTDNFIKEFPHLWQQFHELLPCKDFLYFNLWSSMQGFPEHRDSAEMIDAPASFRIKLYDENPVETLFVVDNPTSPYTNEPTQFLPQVEGTNSYMWNNLRVKHGSIYDPKYKKILAVIAGLVDFDQYQELLDKSTSVYKDSCITSKYSIENYVNI